MKVNAHTALSSDKVLLVPYNGHHVPTYHEWMKDPDLQAATASEPLSREEEYAMQRSWRTDHDKLTFIICLPLDQHAQPQGQHTAVHVGLDDAPERMIGDINLFLFPPENDDNDEDSTSSNHSEFVVIGELELMIARKELQRQGYGRAALLTFMGYIVCNWAHIYTEYSSNDAVSEAPKASNPSGTISQLAYFRVRIQESNVGSIHLFESVGFKRIADKANYFGEVELRWRDDATAFLRRLKNLPMMQGEESWKAGLLPYDEHAVNGSDS